MRILNAPVSISINNEKPGIAVVDSFLGEPMEHREFALGLKYGQKHSVGVRSEYAYSYREFELAFSRILQRKIFNWYTGVNGCYQWCNKHQELVYHVDRQRYSAVLFLTPDAPHTSGTSFWKSRQSGKREHQSGDSSQTFGPNGEYLKDPDQWELVDCIGNVFNRLVIFYGQYIHSASEYFGEEVHDSRLFQIFFFDCE